MNTITPKQFVSNLDIPYPGKVIINGTEYLNVQAAREFLQSYEGEVEISLVEVDRNNLQPGLQEDKSSSSAFDDTSFMNSDFIYKIKVRRYMTQPSTPVFTFQSQWNNDIPMPLRIMVGKKIQETKGMVKMELWGEMTDDTEICCMKCGKTLNNPVSRYFGLGPECGGHNYTHQFESNEHFREAIEKNNQKLLQIRWTGWVVKSSIEVKEKVRHV